jgi:hypothetical protein
MARLLLVTGVLLAAATARLGAPCCPAAEAGCQATIDGDDDDDAGRRDLAALPVEFVDATPPSGEWPAPVALTLRAAPVARDVLPFAPKTSPPVVAA